MGIVTPVVTTVRESCFFIDGLWRWRVEVEVG